MKGAIFLPGFKYENVVFAIPLIHLFPVHLCACIVNKWVNQISENNYERELHTLIVKFDGNQTYYWAS